jgi:small-conductance mechanosensitive channel
LFRDLLGRITSITFYTGGGARYLVPLALVLGGFIVGFIFEKTVLRWLRGRASQNYWYSDDIIFDSLRYVVMVWFGLIGVALALYSNTLYFFDGATQAGQEANVTIREAVTSGLTVVFIISVAVLLTRIANGFIKLYTSQIKGLPSSSLLVNVSGIVIFTLAGLISLQSVGVAVAPILTALGVGGLAVALALQETLANFFSGIVIILSRQLRPNDYVSLESGDEGYVTDITWRNTTIRSLNNNTIIVPNSTMSNSIITNYYQPGKQLSLIIPARVGYGMDLARVEEVTLEVGREILQEVPGCVAETEPLVRYNNFGEMSVDFSVILTIREFVDQFAVKHEFMKRLHRRYAEEGIDIPAVMPAFGTESAESAADGSS